MAVAVATCQHVPSECMYAPTKHTVWVLVPVAADSHCQSSKATIAHTSTSYTATAVSTSCAQVICSASAETVGVQDAANRLSKDDCELLVAHMVQRGMLQLDFGFTAYATNTYLFAALCHR